MSDSNQRPLIIKRKKVSGGDGHHGGAWKVAYADFVTAMMAFFLLMWLLNATTESQRKGIADYFAPTPPISPVSGGGDGVLAGDTVFDTDTLPGSSPQPGNAAQTREGPITGGESLEPNEEAGELEQSLEALETELLGMSGESDVADDLLSHIVTRVTDEGLVIDIFAREGRPLFESGSDAPTDKMRAILTMIADVANIVTNEIALEGHTDATPFATDANDNWRLSSARADSSRRFLVAAGVDDGRIDRVTGKADRELALPDAPEDPRNRRITITLLRSDI